MISLFLVPTFNSLRVPKSSRFWLKLKPLRFSILTGILPRPRDDAYLGEIFHPSIHSLNHWYRSGFRLASRSGLNPRNRVCQPSYIDIYNIYLYILYRYIYTKVRVINPQTCWKLSLEILIFLNWILSSSS